MSDPHIAEPVLEVRTTSAAEILTTGACALLGIFLGTAVATRASGMPRQVLATSLLGASLAVLLSLLLRRPRRPYSLVLTREFLLGPNLPAGARSKVPVLGLPLGPLERATAFLQFTPSTVRLVASDGAVVAFRAIHFPRTRLRALLAALRSLQAGAA